MQKFIISNDITFKLLEKYDKICIECENTSIYKIIEKQSKYI
jgi:hypothetical protein